MNIEKTLTNLRNIISISKIVKGNISICNMRY